VKHGGGRERIALDDQAAPHTERDVDILALDSALRRLAELDERKCKVVEMRFFGGLSIEETAEALNIARSTVTEDWRFARAWVLRELAEAAA
jgi:RNA polymerase sigma factor (TIGR02999 family)